MTDSQLVENLISYSPRSLSNNELFLIIPRHEKGVFSSQGVN